MKKTMKWLSILMVSLSLFGCANMDEPSTDHSAFQASKPKSILILPPINHSPDVKATNSVYAQISYPVGESGYYVLPVGVVEETFKSNGLYEADDIQKISIGKLNEIFAPDAILYLTIHDFGSSYQIISSTSKVTVEGKLIDAKTSQPLWTGKATAIEQSDQSGGILGSLVNALVKQVVDTSNNRSHHLVPQANYKLVSAQTKNGLIYGPYSPQQGEPHQ